MVRSTGLSMDNTKDFIIDEAYKLFLNHSYEAVSIRDISNAICFSKGALYHYFKNKEDLFKSVVDKYLFILEISVDIESISLLEYIQLCIRQIEIKLKTLFYFNLVFLHINYISMFADAFRHYPNYAESKRDIINNEVEKIRIVLENAIKMNEIRNDINVNLIALNFYSMIMGISGNLVRNKSIDDTLNLLKEQTSEFYKLLKKN